MKRRFHLVVLPALVCLLSASLIAAEGEVPKADTKAVPAQAQSESQKKLAELIKLFKKEESLTNSLGMVMVWVTNGFRAAQFEVTQSIYQQVAGGNPSKYQGGNLPVDSITLEEATQFCKKLTEQEIKDGKLPKGYYYSLPSESQWEAYVGDAELKLSVTSYYADRRNPEPVGIYPPNKLGLHDVRGNVWDLCDSNVGRGGSWRTFEEWADIHFRYAVAPGQRFDDIGFRIVLQGTAEPPPPATAQAK